MRRHLAIGGSIVIHAAVGLALVAIRAREPAPAVETRGAIEILEVDPASVVELVEIDSGGGGTRGRSDGTPTSATLPGTIRSKLSTRDWIAQVEPRAARLPSARSTTAGTRSPSSERSLSDSLGELATSSEDHESQGPLGSDGADAAAGGARGDGGDGGGRGGGHGRGIGRGVGTGLGALASTGERMPAPPPAPKASKARPAKLIYPTRDTPIVDGQVYIARVKIDAEGFVVGARLTQRLGGTEDDDAASLIFRFRYAPALDDDGRPIRSEVDQQFLVGP
jgi:hypothetical protein